MAQGTASDAATTPTSGLAASGILQKPESSCTLLSAIFTGRIFADTEAHGMYEEFLNADDDIYG